MGPEISCVNAPEFGADSPKSIINMAIAGAIQRHNPGPRRSQPLLSAAAAASAPTPAGDEKIRRLRRADGRRGFKERNWSSMCVFIVLDTFFVQAGAHLLQSVAIAACGSVGRDFQ